MTNTIKPGDTVYLVKYALSGGIQERVIHEISQSGEYVYLTDSTWSSYRIGRDILTDRAAAEKAADAMRVKKIASLRKKLAKLEKMDFTEIKESKHG